MGIKTNDSNKQTPFYWRYSLIEWEKILIDSTSDWVSVAKIYTKDLKETPKRQENNPIFKTGQDTRQRVIKRGITNIWEPFYFNNPHP